MTSQRMLHFSFLGLCLLASQTQADARMDELFNMPLEDLLNIKVTTTNRASESLKQSASAVTVITQQDIKNSGIRTIPELMRLIPGFHVKRIDGNKWAINSRRIPNRLSDSMQVLMDGRTLYNPLFAGTFWDVQDTLIEDIDHIEVIRGPGSTAWGANAITGVINIVTKDAANAQGGLAYAGAGKGEMEYEAGIRQGFKTGEGSMRVYGKSRRTDEGAYHASRGSNNISNNPQYVNDLDANDGIESDQTGFRYDLVQSNTTHTLQGNWHQAETDDVRTLRDMSGLITSYTPNTIDSESYHMLYNMNQVLQAGSRVEVTAYYDYTEQFSGAFHDKREIVNIESIYHKNISQHAVSIGASYRSVSDDTAAQSAFGFGLMPATRTDDLFGVFLQDRWEVLADTFWVTAGARVEKNDYSGTEINPSLRSTYALSEDVMIWTAVTRSVRTPSRSNADAYLGSMVFIGSTSSDPVVTDSYELGYRQMFTPTLNLDLALFSDRENDPLADRTGETIRHANYNGAEAELTWQPTQNWQLISSITYLGIQPDKRSTVGAADAETWSGQFRSNYKINDDVAWNLLTFYSDGQYDFSAETRVDTNIIWHVNKSLELQFSLNNLLDDYHYEAGDSTRLNSAIRRGGLILATVKF